MTMAIESTTLCHCLHINAAHDAEQNCTACSRCQRFSPGARTSSHHYQRGQRSTRKRVARLEPGDRVLVGFPGYTEVVKDEQGNLTYELVGDERQLVVSHVQDHKLRFADKKTGALVATVTGRRSEAADYRSGFYGRRGPTRHVIETDLGDLPPAAGINSVMVLA